MFEGALIVFAILLIFIGAALLPWWVFPAMIVGALIWWYLEYWR